jgi:hypothetical protein
MERRYVRQVLTAVGGNKTHAARILGIDRRSLYRRLEEPRAEQRKEGDSKTWNGSSTEPSNHNTGGGAASNSNGAGNHHPRPPTPGDANPATPGELE